VPELPEVETIVRDLAEDIIGSRLSRATVHRPNVLRNISSTRLARDLNGTRAVDFTRRAKNIVMRLEDGRRLVIQLRMTGSLGIRSGRLRAEDKAYLVFQIGLGSGRTFLFKDVRRLGTIQLMDQRQWDTFESRIGPEPLVSSFRSTTLARQLSSTRMAIKKAIMDQRKIAGVGNIYANEALFLAGIDPARPANSLETREYQALYRTIRRVLRAGIRSRGTTLKDYRAGDGSKGGFQNRLKVYGRGGQPCVKCGTELVTTHEIDKRATTACWRCQT
jgi:formamidopyrimidine-DNA glycosylase